MCCFCLPRMIVPETIAHLKAMFEKISLRPWKSTRSLSRFLKLCLLNIVEFCKGGSQMGGKFFWYIFASCSSCRTMT